MYHGLLYKVGTQLWDSHAHYGRPKQIWEVQQRSIQVERVDRIFVTHLNDSAIGISERQEQRI